MDCGLPNIVGTGAANLNGGDGSGTGAIRLAYYNPWGIQGVQTGGYYLTFDASRCTTIYGASTVVRPKSLGVAWYIKY